jgi:sporulation protein YlmC with PRC-barrel domain
MKTHLIGIVIAAALSCATSGLAADEKKPDTYPNLVAGSEIKGTHVKNLQNQDLGEIEEVLIEPDTGRARFVVLEVGGFLGVGANKVAVPWGSFTLSKEGDKPKWVLDATKDRLEKAPKVDGKHYDRLYTRENAEPIYVYWKETWIATP